MKECHKHEFPAISGEETWNLIKECGCDPDSLPKIYCVVIKDVDKLRMIFQCPT
jgi:DNA-directed RNA polymerase subunit H (RpoH/RPB5)